MAQCRVVGKSSAWPLRGRWRENPEIILADEPTAALDSTSAAFSLCQLASRKSVVLTQLRWAVWTVKMKNGLESATNNMHVSRSMVVGVNYWPQAISQINARHFAIDIRSKT